MGSTGFVCGQGDGFGAEITLCRWIDKRLGLNHNRDNLVGLGVLCVQLFRLLSIRGLLMLFVEKEVMWGDLWSINNVALKNKKGRFYAPF